MSSNGLDPNRSPLAQLREAPSNPHGFRGFGPLIALAVLLVLMVLLAPTVAPEQIVLVPSDETSTTTTSVIEGAAP